MWKRGPWWAPIILALVAGACGSTPSTGEATDVATRGGSSSSLDSATSQDAQSAQSSDGTSTSQADGVVVGADGGGPGDLSSDGSSDDAATHDATDEDGSPGDGESGSLDGEGSPDAVAEPFVEGWQAEALGDLGELTSIFAIDRQEAYAVGGSQVVRYNGEVWASFGSLGDVTLEGVWSGDGVVVVVGESGFIARRSITGLFWEIEESNTFQHLHAIHGRGADDLWAAGNEGVILNYAGADAGWVVVDETSNIDLHGIHVDPEQEGEAGVVTCGTGGRLVLHDAGVWKTSHVAQVHVTLNGIFGLNGSLFVVGTGGTISVRDGVNGSWVGQVTNLTKERNIYAVGASHQNKVYAFGESGTVLRWLGTSWQKVEVGAPLHAGDDYVSAAWAKGVDDAAGHWMVIGATGGGITSSDGASWSDMTTQPTAGLTDLVETDDGRLWATGRKGVLMTRKQGDWSSIGTGTTHDLNGLDVSSEGELWIVGEAATVIVRSVDGTFQTMTVPVPPTAELLQVHHDSDLAVIGGVGGILLRRPAGEEGFSPWTIGMTTSVRAIERGGDGALWIAGGQGKLFRSDDGESATSVASGVSGALRAIAPTEDGVLIVGDNGVLLRASGEGEVSLLYEQSELFLYGLSVSGSHTVAVGWNGTALRIVGDEIIVEETGSPRELEAVWHDGVRAVAVGHVGYAYTRMEGP